MDAWGETRLQEAGPAKAGSIEALPVKTRPLEAGPAKAGSIEALPGKARPGEAGPEKTHKTDQNFPSALTLNRNAFPGPGSEAWFEAEPGGFESSERIQTGPDRTSRNPGLLEFALSVSTNLEAELEKTGPRVAPN